MHLGLCGFLKQVGSYQIHILVDITEVFYWCVKYSSIEVTDQVEMFILNREWVSNFPHAFHIYRYRTVEYYSNEDA